MTDKEVASVKFHLIIPTTCTAPQVHLWEVHSCVQAKNAQLRKPQVKIVDDYFLIYNRGHNTTLLNHVNKTCPDQIRKISRNVNFT